MTRFKFGLVLFIATIIAISACQNHEGADQDHNHEASAPAADAHAAEGDSDAHEHSEDATKVMLINNDIELFAEVVHHGEELEITAHFTQLNNYKPLKNIMPVWKIFGKNQQLLGKTTLKHVHEGIYTGAIKVHSGEALSHQFNFSTKGHEFVLNENNNLFKTAGQGSITYLKEQAWKDKFSISRAEKRAFARTLKTSGKIALAPESAVEIAARNHGIVKYYGDPLIPGQTVTRGQHILTIQGNESNLSNNNIVYQNAKRTFEKVKKDYERVSKLWEEQIISEKVYLQTKLEYENAKDRFEVLAEDFSTEGRIIRASMDGYIDEVLINNGQHVSAGQSLITLVATDKLLLKADISQKDAGLLSQIEEANFIVQGMANMVSTGPLKKEHIIYGKTMQGAFTTVSIMIDNTKDFIPGSYADVFLKLKDKTPAMVIPRRALMESEGNYYVYVMTGGETFEKRDIETGDHDGEMVVIKSGLAEGEYVVNQGAYNIKLASVSGNIPTHHSH